MQRTEHYSLPQWGANDEIRREDFNAAMEDIDMGMAEQKTKQETGDAQLWNGLLQMGERYLKERYAAMDETALTVEPNLLLNPLSSAEMADTLVEADWDAEQKVHIGRKPEVDRAWLRGYHTSHGIAYTNVVYSDYKKTAIYEFAAPENAMILDFKLGYIFYFSATESNFIGGNFTFTAYENQDGTYVAVYEKHDIPLEASGADHLTGSVDIPVEVPIKEGYDYRLELHLKEGQGVLGRFGFSTETDSDNSLFTVHLNAVTEGSHSHTLTTRGDTVRAVVLLEFQQEEEADGITVLLDGAELDEVERVTTQGDGTATHTVTCIGRGTVGKNHTLTFHLSCGETDKLYLSKYGVYLM